MTKKHTADINRQMSTTCTICKNNPQRCLLERKLCLLDLDHNEQQQQKTAQTVRQVSLSLALMIATNYHKVLVRLLNQ